MFLTSFTSSNPNSLVILFLSVETVNEFRKEKTKTRILLKSIFIPQIFNYFRAGNFLLMLGKSCLLRRTVQRNLRVSFFLAPGSQSFSGRSGSRFLSEASGEIIFLFVFFLFFFNFVLFCFFFVFILQ